MSYMMRPASSVDAICSWQRHLRTCYISSLLSIDRAALCKAQKMQFMLHSDIPQRYVLFLVGRNPEACLAFHIPREAFKPCSLAVLHHLAFLSESKQMTTLHAFQLRQHTCSRSRDRCTYQSSCCMRVRATEDKRRLVSIGHLSQTALD